MTLSLRGHSLAAMLQLVPGPGLNISARAGSLKRDFPEEKKKEFIYLKRNIKSIEEESRVKMNLNTVLKIEIGRSVGSHKFNSLDKNLIMHVEFGITVA